MEVRDEHLWEVDQPHRRAKELSLRSLGTVEEKAVSPSAHEQRSRCSLGGGHRAGRAEEDDVEIHAAILGLSRPSERAALGSASVQPEAVLNVTTWGTGDPAVFVHGSFGRGDFTFSEQRPLAEAYRLLLVDRRGFGGSPASGRVDFERDADDVAGLLDGPAHLVGHSYGGVVSLLAAARRRDAVRSLTVIEPPALGVVRGDPAVEEFIRRVQQAREEAEDPSDYQLRFRDAFGLDAQRQELTGVGLEAARSSWRERPPWEAEIPFDDLRGLRVLVVRGDWKEAPPRARAMGRAALHAACDVIERELDAESVTLGDAHNPQLLGAPFNERLLAFWESV